MSNRRTRNTRKHNINKVAKMPVGGIMPVIKQTRLTQATRFVISIGNFDFFEIDMKRLERNKYAPWGRGDLSGLPVGGV